MKQLARNWLSILAHTAGSLPLFWLLFYYLTAGDSYLFGRTVMLRTGLLGLLFLVAALACSPVSWLFRWPRLVQVRRALGNHRGR